MVLLASRFAGVPVMVCLQLVTGHLEVGADHQDPDENWSHSIRRFHQISERFLRGVYVRCWEGRKIGPFATLASWRFKFFSDQG